MNVPPHFESSRKIISYYSGSEVTKGQNIKSIQYENDKHDYILFQENNENSGMNVDTVDADEVIHTTIQGQDGLVIRKNSRITVVWQSKNQLFMILGNTANLSRAICNVRNDRRGKGRLDVSFGFELHTIRGMTKMKLRCGLALCVMLAMALGHINENEAEKMRSLVA